ncbi:hypothetical protein C5749_14275 [Sphingobacterium gobiense]|uniref:Porin n=2 Tax=Sphingobacterium gobiense TaxID=1382456 RepID=A0A2S9JP21_9SPHI|nr:hypothetical protein C5749_14275 [Sphingobacterium gobiense]
MKKRSPLLTVLLILLASGSHAQEKPELHIGGALRFNYNYSTWKEGQKERGGDFGYDVFRVNVDAKYKGIKMDTEYRLYAQSFGGGFLKRGWVGYDFDEYSDIQIGLTQVPFGIKANSHSWFFGLDYYVGLEDDHDMGIKYTHEGEKFDYAIAFFKNAEELDFGSTSDISDSRYSYDVGSLPGKDGMTYRNKEINQINGLLNYKIDRSGVQHKLGLSAQYGGLYNLDTRKTGNHYALAAHYELNIRNLDIKAQISTYTYNPKAPEGESNEVIAMTAYGAPYLVASRADIYTLGIGYAIPLNWGPVSSVILYNDFGYMDKKKIEFANTFMNVTGAMFTAGQIYTYVDFAAGKNQPWLGPDWTDGLGTGNPEATWSARFNINIGYYF